MVLECGLTDNAEKIQTCLRKAVKFNLTHLDTNSLTLECRIPTQQQGLWEVGGMTLTKYKTLALTPCLWTTLQEHHLGSW